MNKTRPDSHPITRRRFLRTVGAAGGSSLMYRTMGALGMLGVNACNERPELPPSSGDGRKVVILGAGIAGMTAAYELSRAGYECVILEATARAGGRNRTVRAGDLLTETDSQQICDFDIAEHLYLNVGPARIPYHHTNLLGYCRDFGVALEVFTNDNRAAYFHSQSWPEPVVGRRLDTDRRGWMADLLAKAVDRGALDDEISADDHAAFLDMLRDFGALDRSRGYIYRGSGRAGYQGQVNPGMSHPSTLELLDPIPLSDILHHFDFESNGLDFTHGLNQNPTLFQPVGGMDRIAHAFAERVGGLIRHESVVTRIESTADGVRITYRDAVTGDTVTESGDFAICTIPATVLRDIDNDFRPALVNEIQSMVYNNAVKIGFQAERRFWEEDQSIYGGITWTDQEITQVWYQATGYHRSKGILLGAYTWLNSHDRDGTIPGTNPFFTDMSPEERLVTARDQLEHIHPGASAELGPGVSVAWGKVPFQRGGWADEHFGFQDHEELAQGDGHVYFAGEHVSYLNGWQEGAIVSAYAAIDAIADRVAHDMPSATSRGTSR